VKPRPRLVCIPSADTEFTTTSIALLDEINVADQADEVVREQFQRLLRRRFPMAVVRPRHPLAEVAAEVAPVWYVTRPPYRSRLAASIEIAAPPDLVFDVYAEPERIPEWQTAIHVTPLEWHTELIGNEYLARYKVLGTVVQGRFRVVDAERPAYIRIEGGGAGIRLWYASTFTAAGAGTRIDVEGDYDVPTNVLAQAADRLFIDRAVQRDVEYSHANLKALCEELARSALAPDTASRLATAG
jgi:uncharacterized protein YndB with AHSA1/START domain